MDEEIGSEVAQFYVGGIPPLLRFEIEFHKLGYIVESHKDDRWYQKKNPASEVAWVGLIAHFEAFCKHQFSALINISPSLISSFSSRRPQASLKLSDVVPLLEQFEQNIGYLLAEQYDFGSSEKINGLFRDLLNITPFSQEEGKRFEGLLLKRHLLVHHAGVFTLQFLKQTSAPKSIKEQAFRESVEITTEQCNEMSNFLFEMSLKITCGTVRGLKAHIGDTPIDTTRRQALELLLRGVHGDVDEDGW
ncbi:MAG TPA: hypothetical protein VGK77_28435 [Candidatus Binatia bacterium]